MIIVDIAAPNAPTDMRTPNPRASNPSSSLAITGNIDSTAHPNISVTSIASIKDRIIELLTTYLAP